MQKIYLDYHLRNYPKMTNQDIIKLVYQAVLGPLHFSQLDYEKALFLLRDELKQPTLENENLYDLMGTSQANGSRRVNLGANLGEYIYEGLKKIPVAGKAVGALGGAIIDNGMFQRGRRELLELLSRFEKNQTPTWRPDNNILNKINTRIVAPQVTKDLDRQDLSYEMLNPITGLASRQSVERQQDTNLKNFGRTG